MTNSTDRFVNSVNFLANRKILWINDVRKLKYETSKLNLYTGRPRA